jgi:hypothetical protein
VSARHPDLRADPQAELNALVERYVAVWNEPDAALRRRRIADLWTPEGANLTKTLEARGYEALEARVRASHEKWVRDGGCFFRPRDVQGHHGAVRFKWEMVSVSGGEVISVGYDFLVLADDGRIRTDYQFIEP